MADLIQLSDLKNELGIKSSITTDDARLEMLISQVSQWMLTQLNRGTLVASGYTESRNGQGGDSIVPRFYPLLNVDAITINGKTIPPSPDGVQCGFVFDNYSIFLIGHKFCRGRGNVQLTYQAGYADVPDDIQGAVMDQAIFVWRRRSKLGTVSESMNGVITTSFSQKEMAPGVLDVISAYRDKSVVGI